MVEQERPNGEGDRVDYGAATAAAVSDTMHEAEDFVKRQWRDNPIGVAAVVAGLGMLLGLMLGRRR